mmetsp:Transcript_8009/g.11870  ORF Transcript_8009/g.11870 Transcript_8009/m.11870 type:complete len:266 (+) Transcript_8009:282-1079(+)
MDLVAYSSALEMRKADSSHGSVHSAFQKDVYDHRLLFSSSSWTRYCIFHEREHHIQSRYRRKLLDWIAADAWKCFLRFFPHGVSGTAFPRIQTFVEQPDAVREPVFWAPVLAWLHPRRSAPVFMVAAHFQQAVHEGALPPHPGRGICTVLHYFYDSGVWCSLLRDGHHRSASFKRHGILFRHWYETELLAVVFLWYSFHGAVCEERKQVHSRSPLPKRTCPEGPGDTPGRRSARWKTIGRGWNLGSERLRRGGQMKPLASHIYFF